MDKLDWDKAERHITLMISLYAEIGSAGAFGLNITLLPLFRRFLAGERTEELHGEIMGCE